LDSVKAGHGSHVVATGVLPTDCIGRCDSRGSDRQQRPPMTTLEPVEEFRPSAVSHGTTAASARVRGRAS
jgi:hypothetical protein